MLSIWTFESVHFAQILKAEENSFSFATKFMNNVSVISQAVLMKFRMLCLNTNFPLLDQLCKP
jgi:hypothetical protein